PPPRSTSTPEAPGTPPPRGLFSAGRRVDEPYDAGEPRQVRDAGIAARLLHQRGELSAVMRAMIEKMDRRDSARELARAPIDAALVRKRSGEPVGRHVAGPIENVAIGALAFARERREVREHVGAEGGHGAR